MPKLIEAMLLVAFLSVTALSSLQLEKINQAKAANADQNREVLFLPSGKGLNLISFGYQNVMADVLWFNTINYFGKHAKTDRNYKWLTHMCDLVTTLNSGDQDIFVFCSTMLAWEVNDPQGSIKLLSKAIQAQPHNWLFWYLRGFSYLFFLKDNVKAREDLEQAIKLPDVHSVIVTLALKQITSQSGPQTAVTFLTEMIKTADPTSRKVFEKRLLDAKYELALSILEEGRKIFKDKAGREPTDLNELVPTALRKLPEDPFGGTFYIDQASGEIKSTSNKKRLLKSSSEQPKDAPAPQVNTTPQQQ